MSDRTYNALMRLCLCLLGGMVVAIMVAAFIPTGPAWLAGPLWLGGTALCWFGFGLLNRKDDES